MLGATFSFACVNGLSIDTNSTTDNEDGTCTYEVQITVVHDTDVSIVSMQAIGGTFSNCNGGSCTSITADPSGTTVIIATITKNCVDEINVFARGIGSDGFGCGSQGIRFSGLDVGLPAEMVSFTANQDDKANYLSWETSSEENTMVFVIERSLDGINDFEILGSVNAAGNSTLLQSYQFADKSPIAQAYYRIQIVDIDGSYEYSDILVVERLRPDLNIVEVFPVPVVDNEVTVLVHSVKEGPVYIDLFDMTGRVIKQDRITLQAGINRLLLEWDGNESNFYFFTLYNGTERISRKILKANLD